MKINRNIYSKAKDLKNLEIPKDKRKEFIQESTGLCAFIIGTEYEMNEAITDCTKNLSRGVIAVDYIEKAMKWWEQNFNKNYTENPLDNPINF